MRVTATEAKNRFGSLCAHAKREPVFVEKTGRSKRRAFRVPTCAPGERPVGQYDVFTNPSTSAADGIPYVVVIQSELLDALARRLIMPLALADGGHEVPATQCPVIIVKGQRLHALAHYAAPLSAKVLRRSVDNVSAHASALVSAMDAVLSGT